MVEFGYRVGSPNRSRIRRIDQWWTYRITGNHPGSVYMSWGSITNREFAGTGVSNVSVVGGESGGLTLSWVNRYGETESETFASRRDALKRAAEITGIDESKLRIR